MLISGWWAPTHLLPSLAVADLKIFPDEDAHIGLRDAGGWGAALVSQTPPRRTTDCDCTMQDLPPPLHHPVEPKKVLPPVHIRVRWPKRAGATSLCKVYVKFM